MYLEHFALQDYPFRLTPDPQYLFMSEAHARAKSYMDYSLWKRDSFVVITGEIGSGKTTLIENMLAHASDDVVVAKIHQTQLDEKELLQAILVEFGYKPFKASKVELLDMLKTFLFKQYAGNKPVLIVIDEAQNLPTKALEELRLLSDLETHKEKLVNVLLVGQQQLNDVLDSPGLEQLVQRIRLRFHLGGLSEEESGAYIERRLEVAGNRKKNLFSKKSIPMIYKYTGGVPRLINILCDTALTSAYAGGESSVNGDHIILALNELQWVSFKERPKYDEERLPHSRVLQDTQAVAKLLIRHHDGEQSEYLIKKRNVMIGRALSNDVHLADTKVSGVHAQIISSQNESILIDLGSTNGTYVGGRKVKRFRLTDRDEFTLGRRYTVTFIKDPALLESNAFTEYEETDSVMFKH